MVGFVTFCFSFVFCILTKNGYMEPKSPILTTEDLSLIFLLLSCRDSSRGRSSTKHYFTFKSLIDRRKYACLFSISFFEFFSPLLFLAKKPLLKLLGPNWWTVKCFSCWILASANYKALSKRSVKNRWRMSSDIDNDPAAELQLFSWQWMSIILSVYAICCAF